MKIIKKLSLKQYIGFILCFVGILILLHSILCIISIPKALDYEKYDEGTFNKKLCLYTFPIVLDTMILLCCFVTFQSKKFKIVSIVSSIITICSFIIVIVFSIYGEFKYPNEQLDIDPELRINEEASVCFNSFQLLFLKHQFIH